MAELTDGGGACCAPSAQETCCAADEKAACCDTASEGGACGCAAGEAGDGDIRERVRRRYGAAARAMRDGGPGSLCTTDEHGAQVFGGALYGEAGADEPALASSLGCGVPTRVADLAPGEIVLDLGSGAGADVLLSARRVGPAGRAIGLDMTDEMLDLARRNAADAGATNVEFLRGDIESIPLPDDSVDLVISNCVINLSVDKPAVFAEMHRVLRPGGRVGVSDIVAEDHLSAAERAERGSYVGCIAGALSISEYRDGLRAAGFADVEVQLTHAVEDGMHSAIVRAVVPDGS